MALPPRYARTHVHRTPDARERNHAIDRTKRARRISRGASRAGLSGNEFTLRETDTTDPKGDENIGQTGFVTITRHSTHATREYPLGDAGDWLQHFKKDLEAGAFD